MDLWTSRRSSVFATKGVVASSQTIASEIGIRVLQKGGNAADAAVAVAAALNVTQPTSTGIGGDCFALFYDAKEKKVKGLNGSGRAPQQITLQKIRSAGIKGDSIPFTSPFSVTVPGAAAGWVDTVEKFGSGKLTLKEILQPAIELAEEGFPVGEVTSHWWEAGLPLLQNRYAPANDMMINGRAPKAGEVIRMPNLARTFNELATHGKAGFYQGRIAKSIVDLLQSNGVPVTEEDFQSHHSTFDEPIEVDYRGVKIWEMPPNGHGLTTLLALNILENFDLKSFNNNSTTTPSSINPNLFKHHPSDRLHLMIEAMRLAFADSRWYVADPAHVKVPIKGLLCKEYARTRASLLNLNQAIVDVKKGCPASSSDTVYFSVADKDANACSFINSNYAGFGTGMMASGTGFTLHNRGCNFSLQENHPNVIAGGKRPYHTIMPGMATKNGELFASFGVMGGFMQPQGHLQVVVNLVDFEMTPQQALDCPRFCITDGTANGLVYLEDGIPQSTIDHLISNGHHAHALPLVGLDRSCFGIGQIIMRKNGLWLAGSDARSDGAAIPWC